MLDGSFRFSCDVGEAPKRIVITDGWGFVIVEACAHLWLFSINGQFIRKVPLGSAVYDMITWKCERGCDFVAIATEKNQVKVFEAFYLRTDTYVFAAKERIIAMKYILRRRALAVVTVGGEVAILPRDLPESEI
jgi:hypothetical protein